MIKIIIIFFLLISCAGSKKANNIVYEKINFSIDSLVSYYGSSEQSVFIDNKEYLSRINHELNSIDFFNLHEKCFEFRVQLPFNSEVFLFKSLDSIFVIEYEKNELTLLNRKGEIINKINFESKLNDAQQNYVVYATNNSSRMRFCGKSIIFNIVANTIIPKFYNFPTIGIYDYTEENDIIKTAFFPDIMRKGDVWYSFNPTFCINQDDEIVCSFEVDHCVHIYNTKGEYLSSNEIKSKYLDEFAPIELEKSRNRRYSSEYNITRGRYNAIIFDKYRNFYYRIAVHPQNYLNSDGSVNEFGSNQWSIIILDSNFNIIDEVVMEREKFLFSSIIVVSEGLLIRMDDSEEGIEHKMEFFLVKFGGNY